MHLENINSNVHLTKHTHKRTHTEHVNKCEGKCWRDKCLTLNSSNPSGRAVGFFSGDGGRLFEFLECECVHILFAIF